MTRFDTLVLIPESIRQNEIGEYVFNALLPFGAFYEFPPFHIPCECTVANSDGIDEASKKVGNFHVAWRKYSMDPKHDSSYWVQFIKKWEQTAISTARSYPYYKKPNRRCDLCKGAGVYETTQSPWVLYDYWALGEWINLGPANQIPCDEIDGFIYAILLDNGELIKRWGSPKRYSMEEWKEKVCSLLNSSSGYMAIKCLMHN